MRLPLLFLVDNRVGICTDLGSHELTLPVTEILNINSCFSAPKFVTNTARSFLENSGDSPAVGHAVGAASRDSRVDAIAPGKAA